MPADGVVEFYRARSSSTSRRSGPILALVPPVGEAAKLIESTGMGRVVDPEDVDGTVSALRELLERHATDGTKATLLSSELRTSLARRTRATEFLEVLEMVAP